MVSWARVTVTGQREQVANYSSVIKELCITKSMIWSSFPLHFHDLIFIYRDRADCLVNPLPSLAVFFYVAQILYVTSAQSSYSYEVARTGLNNYHNNYSCLRGNFGLVSIWILWVICILNGTGTEFEARIWCMFMLKGEKLCMRIDRHHTML